MDAIVIVIVIIIVIVIAIAIVLFLYYQSHLQKIKMSFFKKINELFNNKKPDQPQPQSQQSFQPRVNFN